MCEGHVEADSARGLMAGPDNDHCLLFYVPSRSKRSSFHVRSLLIPLMQPNRGLLCGRIGRDDNDLRIKVLRRTAAPT